MFMFIISSVIGISIRMMFMCGVLVMWWWCSLCVMC